LLGLLACCHAQAADEPPLSRAARLEAEALALRGIRDGGDAKLREALATRRGELGRNAWNRGDIRAAEQLFRSALDIHTATTPTA
jgi:hypothetical protein